VSRFSSGLSALMDREKSRDREGINIDSEVVVPTEAI
jgi:hypothetical protein